VDYVKSSTFHDGPEWCVSSTSGFGDGGYDVLVVERDGPVGVEVVFVCDAATAAADAAREVVGAAGPHPGWSASAADCAGWAECDARERNAANAAFLETLLATDPDADSVGNVLGCFTHSGGVVEVTDPFCGPAGTGPADSWLPAGDYVAVRWEADFGAWGVRATRLGVYRIDV
jgi:hypothetical protein